MSRILVLCVTVVFVLVPVSVSSQELTPDIFGWYLNTSGITGYNGLPANVQQVQYSASYVYVSSSNIPSYTIGPWNANPNVATNQNFIFKIARNPQVNAGTKTVTPLGHIGVLVNGVSIFNPKDAMSYNNQNIWRQNAVIVEAPSFDTCLGHPQQQGEYHHHQVPRCMLPSDTSTHSPIMGYAFDGFPMYGPYAYEDTDGTGGITRMKSSYRKRNITQRTTLPDGTVLSPSQYGPSVSGTYPLGYYIEDYEYIAGLGDLDQYNGRYCVTPEYPSGIYTYFSTIDSAGNSEYPYLIGPSYYGVVIAGNTGPGGGHVTITESVTSFPGVIAYNSSDTTDESISKNININAKASGGLMVTYALIDSPDHGDLTGVPPSVTYFPDLDYIGSDEFLFSASIPGGVSDTGTVAITVLPIADSSAELPIPPYEVHLKDSLASTGYYFLHAFKLNGTTSFSPSHMVLDRLGNLVYFKTFSRTSSDFKLHANGKMSYAGTSGNPANAKFYIMDSTFTVVDSVQCKNGILTDTHDMQILSNGHYLMLGYEYVTMNLSTYNWFSGNGSPGDTGASVKCGVIQELDENKNVVFTWRTSQHFSFGDVQEERLLDPSSVDWTHCNAAGADSDGNIILSSRFFSEVTKINRLTGEIIWRFGGKNNQFSILNDPYNGFYGQHDPRRIGNGNITVFDNGKSGNPLHPARGVEYEVDEINHTAALVWNYTEPNNSNSGQMGNVQRLSNGNSVIGWGGLRNANVALSSVKQNGESVFDLSFPDSFITYRAFNYPTLPWALNRPVITCYTSGNDNFLDAGAGYNSYLWSTGDTTQTIHIDQPGTYYVFVPYGEGGFISSEKKIVTSITNPCDLDSANMTTVQAEIANRWNLVSLPVSVVNANVSVLFPTSISQAYYYAGHYKTSPSMVNGRGYWLKFDSAQYAPIRGLLRERDTIDVVQGWNIIGSISIPVTTSSIISIPGAIVTSKFFGYDSGYRTVDSLHSGKGYWVKVAQSGKIILSQSGTFSPAARIKIVETNEMPPMPPEEQSTNSGLPLPDRFVLDQNYPNPFNPATTIMYQLPVADFVTIKVYNTLGEEMVTLVNEAQQPGSYEVRWDASNAPSGIYFYRLTSNTFTDVKKMVLMR